MISWESNDARSQDTRIVAIGQGERTLNYAAANTYLSYGRNLALALGPN